MIRILLLAVLFSSCLNSGKQEKPSDELSRFIEKEIIALSEKQATVSKNVVLNDEQENKSYAPEWASELKFLEGYVNEFRKNGELIGSVKSTNGDTMVVSYQKQGGELLQVDYLNNEIVQLTIDINQSSLFGSRILDLRYVTNSRYRLVEKTSLRWLVDNRLEITASFELQ
tara:strand:+ start:473 stop:985 length:513 start_codon:yes stop_codon:yes gene_type:complete